MTEPTHPTVAGNPDIALSVRAHDRVGKRRTDQAWLDETWADPRTRVLVLAGSRFPVGADRAAIAWRAPDEAPDGQRVFLGTQHDVAHFAVLVDDEAAEEAWTGFRAVGPSLSRDDAGLLVHAIALAEWHRAHRHCPRCGGRLEVAQAGHVLTCPDCGKQQFPRTDPAVIMLVTDDDDRCLLGRQAAWPEGRYSTIAGFVEPGESLEDAVAREVLEETGVRIDAADYHSSQPWPFPSSLMIGFTATADGSQAPRADEELQDVRWFTRAEIASGFPGLPPPQSVSYRLIEDWYDAGSATPLRQTPGVRLWGSRRR